MGTMVSYKCPGGKDANGYLAEPAAGSNAPGMVVIQEWWGLSEQIKGVADRLAKAGVHGVRFSNVAAENF
jgi:carboxymethylenebutenolidase